MNKSTFYYEAKRILGYFEQAVLKDLGASHATSLTVKEDQNYRYARVSLGEDSSDAAVVVFVSPSKINFRYGTVGNPHKMNEVVLYRFSPTDDHEGILRELKKITRELNRIISKNPTHPDSGFFCVFFERNVPGKH